MEKPLPGLPAGAVGMELLFADYTIAAVMMAIL